MPQGHTQAEAQRVLNAFNESQPSQKAIQVIFLQSYQQYYIPQYQHVSQHLRIVQINIST